jgi:hypothetical protein
VFFVPLLSVFVSKLPCFCFFLCWAAVSVVAGCFGLVGFVCFVVVSRFPCSCRFCLANSIMLNEICASGDRKKKKSYTLRYSEIVLTYSNRVLN